MADLLRVMEREQLHSEHAALCWLDAKRKARQATKAAALRSDSKNHPGVRDNSVSHDDGIERSNDGGKRSDN